MKTQIFFMIVFFAPLFISAQEGNLVYRDDYSNPNSGWEFFDDGKTVAKIKDGFYQLKNTKHSMRCFYQQVFIDYREDFRIEVKLKQTTGETSNGYGLIWGSKGWENSYNFIISSTGYFSIGGYNNKNYFDIQPWKKTGAINPLGQDNVLVIEKKGILYNFIINNETVYTCKFERFYGQILGYILRENTSISVDYIQVTSQQRKIDVVSTVLSSFTKENIGMNINSPYSEIAPIISPDGKTLYFGRIYHPANYGKEKESDIWYSELQEDGTWGKAKNIGKPLNNDGVNVVITVTPDGNSLLLEGLYKADGSHLSEQGISISHRTERGWSVPKEVKVKNFYNKNIYETYCLSNDHNVLILSVERDDSYGDLDLYISFRNEDGTYTEPKNIGPALNTFASDGTPFLASDNTTLYFSSYGRTGYGSADIYVTKRLDDTWMKWSPPKNLGPSINTSDWDTYLSISAKGDYAYLVSTHGSYGNEDIFKLKLKEEIQPDPVVLIFGKVINQKTNKPIQANISYENLKNGKRVGIAQSDPQSGNYKIVLPYGINYGFRAEAKNFIAMSENIDLKNIKEYQEIKRDLYLVPIEVGEIVILQNVFFEQAKPVLLEESYPELDRLVTIMKTNPKLEIEIGGHTDNRGNPLSLQQLSEDRVKAVVDYLKEKGVPEKRLIGKGYGGTKPIYTGNSEEERMKNRRVEFKILKM